MQTYAASDGYIEELSKTVTVREWKKKCWNTTQTWIIISHYLNQWVFDCHTYLWHKL